MPSVDDVYGSSYLTTDFARTNGLVNKELAIENISTREIEGRRPGEEARLRLIIKLREIDKEYICGKKNAQILAEKFGKDYSQWSGKKFMFVVVKTNLKDESGNYRDGLQIVPII